MVSPLFAITDSNDNILSDIDLGVLGDNDTFKFRLHNNLNGAVITPIPKAENVSLNLITEPLPANETLLANKVYEVRCVYSAKLQSVINEDWQKFPITSENYDVIDVGQYNEYEVRHNYSLLTDAQKSLIRNKQLRYWILIGV